MQDFLSLEAAQNNSSRAIGSIIRLADQFYETPVRELLGNIHKQMQRYEELKTISSRVVNNYVLMMFVTIKVTRAQRLRQ